MIPENPADILREARALEQSLPVTTIRLAILASFTSDLMRPYLLVESHRLGLPMLSWHGPFGQFEQMVLQDSSLWAQEPDALWIAMRLEDIEPNLIDRPLFSGSSQAQVRLEKARQRLVNLVESARSRTKAPIFVSNFELARIRSSRPFEASDPEGLFYLVEQTNRDLALALQKLTDVYVFDWAGVVNECGASGFTDPKLWYTARVPIAASQLPGTSRALVRTIAAVLSPRAKCIVLDLDNTLWGGVVGDDGPDGIKIGGGNPGNVFKDLQSALLGYADQGFLLAIASKNDAALVEEVLRTHPEMLLRQEHFACIRANWEPKPQNLREIAQTLNIGLDSLLFVDDNPVERAQMRAELPMVHVLELPDDPLGYLRALRSCPFLDRPRVLSEDLQRVAMYRENTLRQELREKSQSLEEYLQHLDMVAEVGFDTRVHLDRIQQLINKTNQFNLTTRRYKLDEVRAMMEDPAYVVAWLRLSDRFGDMGLVCVGILHKVDSVVMEIDTLLMSCRVAGRMVEDAFMAYLADLASQAGASKLRGLYRKTSKNMPVAGFYAARGFVSMPSGADGEERFEKNVLSGAFVWPQIIKKGTR